MPVQRDSSRILGEGRGFQREWGSYYHEDWVPPDSSQEGPNTRPSRRSENRPAHQPPAVSKSAFRPPGLHLPERGEFNGQAQSSLGAAIEAEGATGISFENCEFSHSMTYVLCFGRGCRDISVKHSWMHDLGAGA